MFRVLATIFLFYLLFRSMGYFLRFLLGTSPSAKQTRSSATDYKKSHNNGNVHIDYVPKKEKKKDKEDFNGGEYIDYEEVK